MRVKKVKYLGEYKLELLFSDRKRKVVNLEDLAKKGKNMLAPLKDVEYFKQVKSDGTTIVWPNGVDLCPDVLYETGKEITTHKAEKTVKQRIDRVSERSKKKAG